MSINTIKLLFQRIASKTGRSFYIKTGPISMLDGPAQKKTESHSGRHATVYSCAGPRLAPDEEPYPEDPDQ